MLRSSTQANQKTNKLLLKKFDKYLVSKFDMNLYIFLYINSKNNHAIEIVP